MAGKRVLIFGGTGLLGQALKREAEARGLSSVVAARRNADLVMDIRKPTALAAFDFRHFDFVINAAAITSLEACEADPEGAYSVNAKPVGQMAEVAREVGAYFVHISTDHYFSGDAAAKHRETAPVILLNEYARSKFAGESLALRNPEALVVRTNIVGWRNWPGAPTFVEWVLAQLDSGAGFMAFTDFFTSSIEVGQFSRAIFDLLLQERAQRPVGVLNLASSQVASKKEFIEAFALAGGYGLDSMTHGRIKDRLGVPRAESLGLDVSMAERYLGYPLPNLRAVIQALWENRR